MPEYLAAGMPVVAYERTVFQSEFEGHLELWDRGDWEAVSRALIRWIQDPEACRHQGGRGRAFVRRFDYRRVAEEELALMSNLAVAKDQPLE